MDGEKFHFRYNMLYKFRNLLQIKNQIYLDHSPVLRMSKKGMADSARVILNVNDRLHRE